MKRCPVCGGKLVFVSRDEHEKLYKCENCKLLAKGRKNA